MPLVPCYKRARPEIRGLIDPTAYDHEVWALGAPDEAPPAAIPVPPPVEALPSTPGNDVTAYDTPVRRARKAR